MTQPIQPVRAVSPIVPAPAPAPLYKALLAAGLVAPLAAYGATITVTTTAAENPASCTLRDAARTINSGAQVGACAPSGSLGGANTVAFAPAVTGTITYGDQMDGFGAGVWFRPGSNLTIVGPGAANLAIACTGTGFAGLQFAGLHVDASNSVVDIGISGLTVQDCYANPGANTELAGGITAITRADSNTAATVTLSNLVVKNNSSYTGGIFAKGSTIDVNRITAAGNTGRIGGLSTNGQTVTLRNSTLSGNTGNSFASAAFLHAAGRATVQNTTASGNNALGYVSNVYAAVQIEAGEVLVDHATVVRNTGRPNSVGLAIYFGYEERAAQLMAASAAPVRNSIVCDNTGGAGDFASNANLVGDYNLLGVISTTAGGYLGGTGNVSDCTGAQLANWLGPLANNGGPTQTHALLDAGNPAINGGDPEYAGATTDQRTGTFQRVVAGRTDMGAFEFGAAEAPISPTPVPALGPVALGALSAALAALGMRRRRRAGDK